MATPLTPPLKKTPLFRTVIYSGMGHPELEKWPAVVIEQAADETVTVFAMTTKGHRIVSKVTEGTGVNQWSWPVLVPDPPAEPAPALAPAA